jgi:IS30 family transposase
MDIFRLLYAEGLKPAHTGRLLNRSPSSISREIAKGMDQGTYNPFVAEPRHLESRKSQCPALKMTGEAWNLVKPELFVPIARQGFRELGAESPTR